MSSINPEIQSQLEQLGVTFAPHTSKGLNPHPEAVEITIPANDIERNKLIAPLLELIITPPNFKYYVRLENSQGGSMYDEAITPDAKGPPTNARDAIRFSLDRHEDYVSAYGLAMITIHLFPRAWDWGREP